jgi:hypothetical protein
MLLYHTLARNLERPADPLRATFVNNLRNRSAGDYRRTALCVAPLKAAGNVEQGFNPTSAPRSIQYSYNFFFVNVAQGNVWAVRTETLARSSTAQSAVLFRTDAWCECLRKTLPWDSAPGGWGTRDSMARWTRVLSPPVGTSMALYPKPLLHPTVSATPTNTNDPLSTMWAAIDPDLLAHSPSSAVRAAANEPHVTVHPDNAPWLLE